MLAGRRRSFEVGAAAFVVVLALTITSRLVLATIVVPRQSDVPVYERYAASVAAALQHGTSFSIERDRILREGAAREGRPQPTSDDLLIEYPPLTVTWMALVGIGIDAAPNPGSPPDPYSERYRGVLLALELLIMLILLTWGAQTFRSSGAPGRLGAWQLAIYGIGGLVLGNLLFDRLDLVVGGLILGRPSSWSAAGGGPRSSSSRSRSTSRPRPCRWRRCGWSHPCLHGYSSVHGSGPPR